MVKAYTDALRNQKEEQDLNVFGCLEAFGMPPPLAIHFLVIVSFLMIDGFCEKQGSQIGDEGIK